MTRYSKELTLEQFYNWFTGYKRDILYKVYSNNVLISIGKLEAVRMNTLSDSAIMLSNNVFIKDAKPLDIRYTSITDTLHYNYGLVPLDKKDSELLLDSIQLISNKVKDESFSKNCYLQMLNFYVETLKEILNRQK